MNYYSNTASPGVYIIGAGPGEPDLLTVKAQKLIHQADVILFADSLIPIEILQGCRHDAEILRTASQTLETIVPIMVDRVNRGQIVVRLHSGDPSLYSAIYEQMRLLENVDIPVEIVPGISAYQAAAAKLKAELTVPGLVQTVILTRISGRTQVPDSEDLATLAAHQASLCLYLSAKHIHAAQAKLLEHYPPNTPVAVCYRIGWEDESIEVVPLENMAEFSDRSNFVRTTLYIISPALAQQNNNTWRSRLYHPDHQRLFREQ